MKKILSLILALSLCLLTACAGISDRAVEKTVEEFILAVEEDRFEDAAKLIHSEHNINANDISAYFALLEKDDDADFSGNFQLIEYEFEDFEETDPIIEGEHVKVNGIVETKEETFTFVMKLVKNDTDFGIYGVKFDEK